MSTSPNEPTDAARTPSQGSPTGPPATSYPPPPTVGQPPLGTTGTADYRPPTSTSDTAKDEAKHVKDTAAQATQQVAGTAKAEAGRVAADARDQARQLADETRAQISDQASSQRDRAVKGLRSLGNELEDMTAQSSQSGLGNQLARQGAGWSHQTADFLEQRDPSQLLDEVRDFARRRPGAFLLGAAVAGVVVGRLSRGAIGARKDDTGETGSAEIRAPSAYPPASTYPPPQGDPMTQRIQAEQQAGWAQGSQTPIVDEPYGEGLPPEGYSRGAEPRP